MEFIDYYKILEIPSTAGEADIKSAYRKLARKYHPDINPNDENAKKKFQQINEANEVLSDPEKRKKYDKYGKDWKHGAEYENANQHYGSSSKRPGSGNFSDGFTDFGDFSEFFESMYGAGSGRGRQTKFRGQDLNAELQLNLLDVYKTHQRTLTVNGKNIRLTIPAGVENGQVIKIAGHGNPGANGGPQGDLYITFSIADHPTFKREGNNLYVNVDLDLYTALLGGEVLIETLDGKVKLKAAAETQSGTKVKLKGKGFPVYKKEGQFGDLYITYQVKLPTQLSEKEKELVRELSKLRKHGN
ncbi:MAG: chaperone DnaJ domain protein [Bacteroidetes bacterium]|jgi:curved DNA-binding protein|nr:chaperone DnaJ domain protein [Bacteroidota bacterium]MDF2453079.1 chaperone DnaJ domain protein [Bacteroidota bacterium]